MLGGAGGGEAEEVRRKEEASSMAGEYRGGSDRRRFIIKVFDNCVDIDERDELVDALDNDRHR